MKKNIKNLVFSFVFSCFLSIIFSNCGSLSYTLSWNNAAMDNPAYIPLEYIQTFKNENERMLYVSPLLSSNIWFSNLYIITNPKDIQNAKDAFAKLNNLDAVPFNTIENILKPFSAIRIQSSSDTPVGFSIPIGNGLAAFSLPNSIENIFYVYISYKSGIKHTSPYNTKVWFDIISIKSNNDVFITFSEPENNVIVSVETNPIVINELYYTKIIPRKGSSGNYINGRYGNYLSSGQKQTGFIEINFSQIMAGYQLVKITPPPQNIARPQIKEQYTIPVTATLIGDYAKYNVITARDIVGKSQPWQLSKDQILDWIKLNENNTDFTNALAICTIIADKYDYNYSNFVCVDYCAMFINLDTVANDRRLGDKISLVLDENHSHIWMLINIQNKYRDANGNIKQASYLWVDPTWFDNGNIYNFNNFTWGGEYVPQFMEGIDINGRQNHKFPTQINWANEYGVIPGMTYSVSRINGRNVCIQDDFGRRGNR